MATAQTTPVDTAKVTDRRKVRYPSISDLLRDAEALAAAERAGTLRHLGNWTLGQAFGHIASWMSYPYEGFPVPRAPWFVRLIVGMRKQKYLNEGMPAGVRIPGAAEGTYGTEVLTTEAGLARLRAAAERLQRGERPVHPSPVFGEVTMDECTRMNLRHAELHLSFFASS